jgi:ABC-type Fe3+-hydroxamate transport system substrate-binding protein
MANVLDVTTARSRFPALQQEQVYMDNAGRWDTRPPLARLIASQ